MGQGRSIIVLDTTVHENGVKDILDLVYRGVRNSILSYLGSCLYTGCCFSCYYECYTVPLQLSIRLSLGLLELSLVTSRGVSSCSFLFQLIERYFRLCLTCWLLALGLREGSYPSYAVIILGFFFVSDLSTLYSKSSGAL
jgi:hypothetical protein